MIPAYALIEVFVGSEKVSARPVRWDAEDFTGFGKTETGEDLVVTGYHTTCPFCGNLIDFDSKLIYLDEDENQHVKCDSCGVGTQNPSTVKTEAVFTDPILNNQFNGVEIDYEILKILDLKDD